MTKICNFIFLIILLSVKFNVQAQYSYGVRLGALVPAMVASGSDPFTNEIIKISDYRYKYTSTPFYAGVYGEYKFDNEKSGIQLSLTYENSGLSVEKKITYEGLVEKATQITINSPEVLINLIYKHSFFSSKFHALVGVYIAYIFNNTMETQTPLVYPEFNMDFIVTQTTKFKNVNLGFVVGGEYFISRHVFLDARIHFGIVNMISPTVPLKITPESLQQSIPTFLAAIENTQGTPNYDKVLRLAGLSTEHGKILKDVNMYSLVTQIGIGWQF